MQTVGYWNGQVHKNPYGPRGRGSRHKFQRYGDTISDSQHGFYRSYLQRQYICLHWST
jgi:hypothetical protein